RRGQHAVRDFLLDLVEQRFPSLPVELSSERTDISDPPDRLGCREARCRACGRSHGGGPREACQASARSGRTSADARRKERTMYEGFRRFDLETSDPGVAIHGVVGGEGPPLLLLHGNPLTHIHWRLCAPRLATEFTVVATDLRGYGDSGKPRGLPD